MTRKEFELEMLRCLRAHRLRAPQMQEQDAVKFVFQAMLGPGHLLADRDTVTERIAREMDGLTPDPDEPLTEELSPAWCRLNLARAAAEGLEPGTVAGLMASPQDGFRFSRQDVLEACRGLTASGEADPERILDGDWLPSHSEIYRDRYRPAYRVIPAYWIPCMEAVIRISGRKPGTGRTTVTIDGPCASGKTTLASRLAGVFSAGTVHTDDFVIPHREKTPERLAVPGGNCDAGRLVREVLLSWKAGRAVRYRRYDCAEDRLLPEETVPETDMLIVEGCYSSLPAIRDFADVRIFLDAPWETREARLRARESPESLERFHALWIPLEDAYFAAYGLPDPDCVRIW